MKFNMSLMEVLVSLILFSIVILGAGNIALKSQQYHRESFVKTQQLLNENKP